MFTKTRVDEYHFSVAYIKFCILMNHQYLSLYFIN